MDNFLHQQERIWLNRVLDFYRECLSFSLKTSCPLIGFACFTKQMKHGECRREVNICVKRVIQSVRITLKILLVVSAFISIIQGAVKPKMLLSYKARSVAEYVVKTLFFIVENNDVKIEIQRGGLIEGQLSFFTGGHCECKLEGKS